jgi:hydroxymethylpyrimidine/phosphomethylpyrimidine kinase
MFGPEETAASRDMLFPMADPITPNRVEAELFMEAGEIEKVGDWNNLPVSRSLLLFRRAAPEWS